MSFKQKMKTGKYTRGLYSALRDAKWNAITTYENKRDFRWHGIFDNRQKGHKKLCIILAGYKTFLYGATFERLKAYIDSDIDVCIITSGLFSPEIQSMCAAEGWSYLSTKENNVSLVQNVSISLHPKAEWIFKLDEDIFITKNYFSNMMRAYEHASNGRYKPGVIAPLIPVNGYGYVRILEKTGRTKEYADRFEKPFYATGSERCIEGSPEAATFMWGEGGIIPSIDELNEEFQNDPIDEKVCAIRFSIGAILFNRSFWEEMRHFSVKMGNGMGQDEVQLCKHCAVSNRPIMVSENTVVGHLSFGPQNEAMKEFFQKNPDKFYLLHKTRKESTVE